MTEKMDWKKEGTEGFCRKRWTVPAKDGYGLSSGQRS